MTDVHLLWTAHILKGFFKKKKKEFYVTLSCVKSIYELVWNTNAKSDKKKSYSIFMYFMICRLGCLPHTMWCVCIIFIRMVCHSHNSHTTPHSTAQHSKDCVSSPSWEILNKPETIRKLIGWFRVFLFHFSYVMCASSRSVRLDEIIRKYNSLRSSSSLFRIWNLIIAKWKLRGLKVAEQRVFHPIKFPWNTLFLELFLTTDEVKSKIFEIQPKIFTRSIKELEMKSA